MTGYSHRMETASFQHYSCSVPTRQEGISEVGDSEVCLPQPEEGCAKVGRDLCGMPMHHGAQPQFSVPERRFDHVNVDLVGLLSPSEGFTLLPTVINNIGCVGSSIHWDLGRQVWCLS